MFNPTKSRNILKKYFTSGISLVILTIIVSLITYYRLRIQMDLGPLSDTCDFLSNALVFAGQGMGYSDLVRPPFFSFITSLFFRLGYVSTATIFVVDGLIFVLGVIGFFLFLKLRFNDIESFLGGLLYATFPIVLAVLGVGFSDLAGVSFIIWAFYFLALAVKKDSKFFYLAFPLAIVAFLTRYNLALIIFPIFLYILINKDEIKKFKNIFGGIFASFLLLLPVFAFFYETFGNVLYPFISFFVTSSTSFLPEYAPYDPNLFYFVDKFLIFIGTAGILIILIIALGMVIYGVLKIKKNSRDEKNSGDRKNSRDRKEKSRSKKGLFYRWDVLDTVTRIKLITLAVLVAVFVGTFGQTFYLVSEAIFFYLGYLFYDLTKNLKIKNMDLNLLVLAWFMTFFIFHSIYVIKDNRYFVTMAPGVAYLLILGLSGISNSLKFKIKNRNITFPVLAVILTFTILLSTVSYLPLVYQANYDTKVTNENIDSASQWFINYDPGYKTKVIYADLYPNFAWSLKTNVKMMPIFKDNKTYSGGVKNLTFTPRDSVAYNRELEDNNADYYFSFRSGLNLTSYRAVNQFGNLIIYQKV